MKIVFATDFYYPSIGGIEMVTRRVATQLSKIGHDVWIIAPSSGKLKGYYKEGLVNVVRVSTPLKLLTPYFLLQKKVFNELKRIGPDVIHMQTSLSIAKAASLYAKKYKVASVVTGHYAKGEAEYVFKKIKVIPRMIDFVVGFTYRSVWKNADIITVPSDFANKYYRAFTKNNREIVTISNGIYADKYLKKSNEKLQKKTILYVGRFVPSKNVEMIVGVLPKILSKIDARLILVGGGTSENKIKNLVKDLKIENRVLFTGFASEEKVRKMYKKANIFVTASAADNQPLTILEAMASGLPVVAAKVGGIPELIKHGKNGFLFKTNNLDSLTRNVLKILLDKNLQIQMGREGVKTAKRHDIKEVVFDMENLYQKAMAINLLKNESIKTIPVYLTRGFAIRISFAVLILGILFRNLLISPTVAHAKGLALKNKIMNSKVVMKIENLDSKIDSLRKAKTN